jgi:uncharacterized RDD family membrane protein YckC
VTLDAHTRYAGFWRRLAATLIDTLLLLTLAIPVMMIFGQGLPQPMQPGTLPHAPGLKELLLNYVLPLALTVFFWVKFLGTPGKLLLSCHVVDAATGAPLRTGQAILRYFAYIVSTLPLCLGFLWIAWDKRKQGFHDKIAKTVVIIEDAAQTSLADLEKELR